MKKNILYTTCIHTLPILGVLALLGCNSIIGTGTPQRVQANAYQNVQLDDGEKLHLAAEIVTFTAPRPAELADLQYRVKQYIDKSLKMSGLTPVEMARQRPNIDELSVSTGESVLLLWQELEPKLVDFYLEKMSADELMAYRNFVATPSGRAALGKISDISLGVNQMVHKILTERINTKVDAIIDHALVEQQKQTSQIQ